FGLRKSGKTSVLLQLEPILSANAVVRIDLQKYEGRARYGGQIFGEILAAMAAKPNITGPVPPEFVSGFAKDVPAGELGFEFSRKFGKLVEVLSQSGYQTPIICALDEIERILPSSSHPKEAVEEFNSLFGTLRALSQEKRTLALLVTDVHPDCNRINQWQQQGVTTNPVYSFFKEMYLLPFGKEDTSDMLDGIGRLMGLELDESLIGTVYQASGGHPYLARQLASLVVSKTASERLDLVSGNQYVEQPFYYSAPLKNYFGENIWGDLSKRHFNSAMAVLRVLASSSEVEEIVSRESLEKKLGSVFSAGQLLDAFLWLTDVGLVVQQTNRGGNGYAMRLPLLRRWLQMEMTEREKAEWQLH
ncbi:MAG TPA: hypothetical protein VJ723_02070, partial [Candidatus Angelobacter sp.]|nr:hypothetical protein [Candidatus Angelobacter sp.]